MSTIMNHIPPLERDIELAKEEIWRMDRDEIVRLALLGIWARDKAIPALKYYGSYMDGNNPEFLKGGFQKYPNPKTAKEALEALPEGEK